MKKNWYRTNMASRGKYIAYCEGDDYWHRDDKLQLQVDYMEGNPQCGMVYSDYDWYFISRCRIINNTLKPYDKKLLRSPQIEDILTRKVDIRTCTVLAKRETAIGILKADPTLHFNDTFKLADIQLWAEISLVSEIHYIDESLATYQILNESTSQSRDRKKGTRFRISVAEMYLYLCHKHNLSEFIKKRYEKSRLQETLKLAFIEQNQKLAESAIRQNPNLSFKNWLRYIGTRHSTFRPIIILADTMLKHVRPKKWYHS